MEKKIDCLFIGYNEVDFAKVEKMARFLGTSSPFYRDMYLDFVKHDNNVYSLPDFYRMFANEQDNSISFGEVLSPAIAYLGTYLNRRGLAFDFVNLFKKEKEMLIEKLTQNNITAIAISTTLYVSGYPILEIMKLIKKYNNSAKVIVGGPFIATSAYTQDEETFHKLLASIGADFYINSPQGETALVNILRAIKENLPFNNINNIFYNEDGRYIGTQKCEENNKLEENMVNWDLFSTRLSKFASIRTAMSCPFSCAFCAFPTHAGKYQTVSVEAVENELNQLEKIGKTKCISFIDDTFNVPSDRFKNILKMMIKNKYGFKWNSYFRCQYADDETVELMKASGCEGVFLGIESGSEKILKRMNKAATLDKFRTGHELLRKYDIITYDSFIVGFPGETHDTVKETIDFIKETKPDFYRAAIWYCEKTTPVWNEREKYKLEGSGFDWSHETMNFATASDLVDHIFLSINDSIWVPQYNFDFISIFHLLNSGMNLSQVKDFIKAFNMGVQNKLRNPDISKISPDLLEKMKTACQFKAMS